MTGGASGVVNTQQISTVEYVNNNKRLRLYRRTVMPKRHASVNFHVTGVVYSKLVRSKYVDNSKRRLRLSVDSYAEENKT